MQVKKKKLLCEKKYLNYSVFRGAFGIIFDLLFALQFDYNKLIFKIFYFCCVCASKHLTAAGR